MRCRSTRRRRGHAALRRSMRRTLRCAGAAAALRRVRIASESVDEDDRLATEAETTPLVESRGPVLKIVAQSAQRHDRVHFLGSERDAVVAEAVQHCRVVWIVVQAHRVGELQTRLQDEFDAPEQVGDRADEAVRLDVRRDELCDVVAQGVRSVFDQVDVDRVVAQLEGGRRRQVDGRPTGLHEDRRVALGAADGFLDLLWGRTCEEDKLVGGVLSLTGLPNERSVLDVTEVDRRHFDLFVSSRAVVIEQRDPFLGGQETRRTDGQQVGEHAMRHPTRHA